MYGDAKMQLRKNLVKDDRTSTIGAFYLDGGIALTTRDVNYADSSSLYPIVEVRIIDGQKTIVVNADVAKRNGFRVFTA